MTALYTFCRYAFQVLLRQRRAKRDRLRDHFRADKQATDRLQSLLREECFSGLIYRMLKNSARICLNLSCESSLVLLRLRRVKQDRLRDHFRADKQAAVGCNLSCERNAFQGETSFTVELMGLHGLNLSCERNAFQGENNLLKFEAEYEKS